jgi:hypothetical protein
VDNRIAHPMNNAIMGLKNQIGLFLEKVAMNNPDVKSMNRRIKHPLN